MKRVIAFLPTVVRILFGLMLVMSGFTWLGRADPGGYLAEAINPSLDRSFVWYRPFLEIVVVPNFGLFARLVGLGELMSGLSLTLGAATRLGASVISFQLLNYGLLNGTSSLIPHLVMIGVVWIGPAFNSGRKFGIDAHLYRRWPNAKIW